MSVRVGFHPDARRELREAFEFYEAERPGLGAEFLDHVEQAVLHVAEFPRSWPIIVGHMRSCTVAGFPYSIIYAERDGAVYVSAIAHSSRRPYYWRGRL